MAEAGCLQGANLPGDARLRDQEGYLQSVVVANRGLTPEHTLEPTTVLKMTD